MTTCIQDLATSHEDKSRAGKEMFEQILKAGKSNTGKMEAEIELRVKERIEAALDKERVVMEEKLEREVSAEK